MAQSKEKNMNTPNYETDEYIETPRGTFRFGFNSMEEAHAEGYSLWFQHDNGVCIVGGGPRLWNGSNSLAVAVRPEKQTT
jgi:hypothetical protein